MPFTSIFSHPEKGIYRSPQHGRTLEEEVKNGRAMDGNLHCGQYLFSRPVEQVLMQTNARYVFAFSKMSGSLRYQLDEHELGGQFDYYSIPVDGRLVFSVDHKVFVPEAGIEKTVTFVLRFDGVRSHKFQDMCKGSLVSIVIKDGQASFLLYESSFSNLPKYQIPLEIVS